MHPQGPGAPPGYGPPGYGAPPGHGPPPGYGGPPPGYGGPPAQGFPPPKKKGMSGCLIAFLVFLGLGALGAIGGGVWFYSEFGEFIGASGEMASVMIEAQKGPGTQEMRDAGCDEALSLDMEKFTDVVQRFEDEIARREGRLSKRQDLDDLDAAHVVSCKVNFGDVPSCKKIAKAFLGATKPNGKLVVTVAKGATQQCSEIYDEDGKLVGDAGGVTLPTP